jgi:hypothetical protein
MLSIVARQALEVDHRLRRISINESKIDLYYLEPARIFGFSRELSPNLSYEQLISRVAERFSEVDLAEHIIRELTLSSRNKKLEKLAEDAGKKCDFKLPTNPALYSESKFTKNLNINYLKMTVKEALQQIKNSMDSGEGIGCVWIFTYTQPENGRIFQSEVMKIKASFSDIGFDFTLNIQVYSSGLYGDATVL